MMNEYNYDYTVVRLTDKQVNTMCVGCPYLTKLGIHDVCYKEEFIKCGVKPNYYEYHKNNKIKNKRKYMVEEES